MRSRWYARCQVARLERAHEERPDARQAQREHHRQREHGERGVGRDELRQAKERVPDRRRGRRAGDPKRGRRRSEAVSRCFVVPHVGEEYAMRGLA